MPTPTLRKWLPLGATLLDFAPVVKIVFDGLEARLFVIAGEALLMTAVTKERAELAQLKQAAGLMSGWIKVRTDPGDPDGLDHRVRTAAVDKIVAVDARTGPKLELFGGGVYLGGVDGEDGIAAARRQLGAGE